jgi:hypothetical protein
MGKEKYMADSIDDAKERVSEAEKDLGEAYKDLGRSHEEKANEDGDTGGFFG